MAAADIECAKRASLSLESSERLDGVATSLIKASSTASRCLNGVFPAVPTPVSGSSGVDTCVAGDVSLLSTVSCLLSVRGDSDGTWASLSSSGGQVVCALLASSEIAVDGEMRVSSLGVGILYKEERTMGWTWNGGRDDCSRYDRREWRYRDYWLEVLRKTKMQCEYVIMNRCKVMFIRLGAFNALKPKSRRVRVQNSAAHSY